MVWRAVWRKTCWESFQPKGGAVASEVFRETSGRLNIAWPKH